MHAQTPFPSDSFPGTVAQVTGGNPATTGIYHDVSYNHDLLPGSPLEVVAVLAIMLHLVVVVVVVVVLVLRCRAVRTAELAALGSFPARDGLAGRLVGLPAVNAAAPTPEPRPGGTPQ